MNDTEREQWVWNDEGLLERYLAWCRRTGRKSMRAYVRSHRRQIDGAVQPVIDGTKRAHHLKYG